MSSFRLMLMFSNGVSKTNRGYVSSFSLLIKQFVIKIMFIFSQNICCQTLAPDRLSVFDLFFSPDSHLAKEDLICDTTGSSQTSGCSSTPV